MTATQAYAEAYPQAGEASARKSGSRLLGKPEIQSEIAALREKADTLAGSAVMTLLERRAFLAAIVRTPVGQVKEDSPLAEEMRVDAKGGVTVKLPCKLRALELDAKLAGEVTPEREKDKPIARNEDLEAALITLHRQMHSGDNHGIH
jgi:hypothetical protein